MSSFFKKSNPIALALFFLFAGKSIGQTSVAVNIYVKVDRDKVEILYDIPLGKGGATQFYAVSLQTDDEMIEPKKVTGTGDEILPGVNRKITWFYKADGFLKEEVSSMKFKVIAVPAKKSKTAKKSSNPREGFNAPPTNKVKKKFPVLGVGLCAAGAGLATFGFLENGKAKDDYALYTDINGTNYVSEAQYKLANDRHLKAQYLMIGGGALLTAGVVAIIRTGKKNKARQAEKRLGLIPAHSPNSFGVGLAYRF